MVKQKTVGQYLCGHEYMELVLRPGTGGEYYCSPEKGHIPRMKIGADQECWQDVVEVVLHEVMEFQIDRHNCRFEPMHFQSRDQHASMMVMSHHVFSDCCAKAAEFLVESHNDLLKAWKAWGKKK